MLNEFLPKILFKCFINKFIKISSLNKIKNEKIKKLKKT